MRPDRHISSVFNKYAGHEVPLNVTVHKMNIGGHDYDIEEYQAVTPSTVLDAIKDEAAAMGLHLRVWLPNMMGTMDYDESRLNVHIRQAADGKFRVTNEFSLG